MLFLLSADNYKVIIQKNISNGVNVIYDGLSSKREMYAPSVGDLIEGLSRGT